MKLLREKGEAEILRKKKNSKYCMSDMDNCNILGGGGGGRERSGGWKRGRGEIQHVESPPPPVVRVQQFSIYFSIILLVNK
jgi:hypothetical protein